MAKLDRLLALVHRLSESTEGLTLDEMAQALEVNRRTAERLRDIIARHFDLDERIDDRRKRFFIRDSLRRVYTRPTAAEVAALQTEALGRQYGQAARAAPLASLLNKVKGALDDREKRRLDPDLDALVRLQRTLLPPGPEATVDPVTLTAVQSAILGGCCIEFDYATDEHPERRWRRVVPYGLVHGSVTYLIGKFPHRDDEPIYFRLDRMTDVRTSETLGCAPDDWDIDAWLTRSFGVWRDEPHDVSLKVSALGAPRARRWRFHPSQSFEDLPDGSMRVRFRTAGLREVAEHLFTWGGGELTVEGPQALFGVLRERIDAATSMLPPAIETQVPGSTTGFVAGDLIMAGMTTSDEMFLPGVPAQLVREALARAGGNEIESGKLASSQSSAALAVNAFDWFLERPTELPPLPGTAGLDWPAVAVDVERQMRFPWAGGRHPWLDAAIETKGHVLGIESKRYEPFRDAKSEKLSTAYDRDVWGDGMEPYTRMRDALRAGAGFRFLDAAQLVKHAFGLVSEGRRIGKAPMLYYLYAEPIEPRPAFITDESLRLHRAEIDRFAAAVAGAEVRFAACSYREWFDTWPACPASHAKALLTRFHL